MDGTFELNKVGWYTVQNVAPNDFLNQKLENDQYGTWFSVKFEGDANTFIWQAKNAPQAGEKVYGHLEKTASGKSVKFRRAKKEDTPQDGATNQTGGAPQKNTAESIDRAVALKAAAQIHASSGANPVDVLKEANIYLAWLKQEQPTTQDLGTATHSTPPQPTEQPEYNPKRPWENRPPANQGMPFEGENYDDEGNLIG